MCYNFPAVQPSVKQELTGESRQPNHSQTVNDSSPAVASGPVVALGPAVAGEDASRYCPVCSQRLISRRCKLICQICGYYMSCADYY